MPKKPPGQGRSKGNKKASGEELWPAATSDVKPESAGHESDRDREKTSKSSDSLRATQDVAKPPRLRRRRSSTVSVTLKPSESTDQSTASRRRGATRRKRRPSEVVSPYSPADRSTLAATITPITATHETGHISEQPGEPRCSGVAGPATYGEATSQASSTSRTVKEEPAVLTPDVDKAAPGTPDGKTRGPDGRPLGEGRVNEGKAGRPGTHTTSFIAPHFQAKSLELFVIVHFVQLLATAAPPPVTSDTAPPTSKEPAGTASMQTRQADVTARPRRYTFTRAAQRFTSGRGRFGSSRGMLTELQPRLEDLLHAFPKKDEQSITRPWFGGREFAGASAVLAVSLALVLFALYRRHKVNSRDVDLCGTADCIEHVHTLGINTGHRPSPCECFGCFVCSGWSNNFRHVNSSVIEQVILRWFATVEKLSLGDYDRHAVTNRPLSMMRQCMSSTSDAEKTVRMLTAFVSERSFAWPTSGEPEEIVDYGRALEVVLELSVVWALPLWFHVHFLPVAASARLQRDRAILVSPSIPPLLGQFTHDMISRYQDGYSIYTGFFLDTVFAFRPPSEAFVTFLTRRSGKVQGQIFHELASAINNRLPQPSLVEIGSIPKLVRNLSAEDWIKALRSVYGARAEDITADDLVFATNGGLIKAIDSIFVSNTPQEVFFHTIWWFVQAVGATISSVLRLSANSVPEGVYFQRLICFYHTDTTYNVLLASINKAMLSTKARLSITSRLENIRSVVVEKLRAYSKLNAEMRRALSAFVEGMSTVIWPEDNFGRPGGFEEYFGKPYNGSDGSFYAEWEWSRLQMYNKHNREAAAIEDYVAASQVFTFSGETMTSYNPLLNVISISVAALSPPFYYGESTSAMFYGGLGFIYAKGIFRAVDMMAHLLKGSTVMASSEPGVTWSLWNASWCLDVQEAERTFPFLPALDVALHGVSSFQGRGVRPSPQRLERLQSRAGLFCHILPRYLSCGLFQEEEFGDVQ
ncbi:hypothetical protein MRX96_023267 [Rhipicephalus microplus]